MILSAASPIHLAKMPGSARPCQFSVRAVAPSCHFTNGYGMELQNLCGLLCVNQRFDIRHVLLVSCQKTSELKTRTCCRAVEWQQNSVSLGPQFGIAGTARRRE